MYTIDKVDDSLYLKLVSKKHHIRWDKRKEPHEVVFDKQDQWEEIQAFVGGILVYVKLPNGEEKHY